MLQISKELIILSPYRLEVARQNIEDDIEKLKRCDQGSSSFNKKIIGGSLEYIWEIESIVRCKNEKVLNEFIKQDNKRG